MTIDLYLNVFFVSGLGLKLMRHCLELAASLSMKEIFLSTKDKMGFYGKLGFVESFPVSILSKVNVMFRGKHFLDKTQSKTPGITWMSLKLDQVVHS